ncbi:hypothetical protein J0871_05030 [Salegentibacter sp. BDJ18]|uniref:hypothetical protein n=1 Tax=Salegentibacter sp. BDJ18 TaxID=2816376 RepID=UPI001AAF49FD|nr:hypothetical protein [Salegentibacter sp. BDJ18]MBO2543773.1 hypothetical protein [Salegentibacter sp. BDJ18]
MSEAKKAWFKQVFIFLKNNYNWLPIIPIMIGGLFQFISISSIGIQYLRMFSLTQLIIDGILAICLTFLVLLVFLCYIYLVHQISVFQTGGQIPYYTESYNEEIKRKKNEHKHFIIILIILIALTFYLGYLSFPDIVNFKFSNTVLLFTFSCLILFFHTVNRIFKLQELWCYYSESVSSVRSFLHSMMHLFFYFQILFILTALEPVVKKWRTFYFNDLTNTKNYTEYVECTKSQFEDFKSGYIVYYNDKYIFSEIRTKNDTIVKISSFEDFINGNCNFD